MSFVGNLFVPYRRVETDEVSEDKLLATESGENGDSLSEQELIASFERKLRKWKIATLISSVFAFFLVFGLGYQRSRLSAQKIPTIFSPAEEDVEYETVVFHNNFWEDRTPYQGPPTDEVDEAWDELYKGIGVIRINENDAQKLVMETLPIPGEDDGYIIGIEVFHQLHCLNSIRKALYPERYNETAGMTPKQLAAYQIHVEHCIDNIRQVIQCYSDISTIAWIINPRHHRPAPDAHTTHICRDFKKLQEWAKERTFTQKEYDLRLAAQQL